MRRHIAQAGTLKRVRERARRMLASEQPLTVDDYLRLADADDLYELIDGVLVERAMAAMWSHEQLSAWMLATLRPYVEAKGLGYVSGSRTAVKISDYRARLPDLLFIRRERTAITTESAIVGAPDWVLEIRSRANYPAEWRSLEIDYRSIGVAELWLVGPAGAGRSGGATARGELRDLRAVGRRAPFVCDCGLLGGGIVAVFRQRASQHAGDAAPAGD
jgi:Uma2 family endonuclease